MNDAQELGTSVEKDMTSYINSLANKHSVPSENYTGKTKITVWQYLSNPVLPDTDYDGISDGKVWENNIGHTTLAGAEKELTELSKELEEEKLLRFSRLSIVGGDFLIPYHVEVNYSPAYLMQMLANMVTEVGPTLGRDTKGKYAWAKASFVASSGEVSYGELGIGGMAHPHLPITYYLIACNNFIRKV